MSISSHFLYLSVREGSWIRNHHQNAITSSLTMTTTLQNFTKILSQLFLITPADRLTDGFQNATLFFSRAETNVLQSIG